MVQNRVFNNKGPDSWSGETAAKGSDWVLTKWPGDRTKKQYTYRIEFPSQNRYIYFLDRDREAIQSILNTLDLDEKITILDK